VVHFARLSRSVMGLAASLALIGCCACSSEHTEAPGANKLTGPATALDAKGYIHDWLILAPIHFGPDFNNENLDKAQIPNEANLTPREGQKQKVTSIEGDDPKAKEVELTWKHVIAKDYFFDVNEMLGLDSSESVGCYAVAYLDAPEEMKGITFSLCSNDDGLIYLNGTNIYTFTGGRATEEDADKVEDVTLHKGTNVVIFKVWNESNAWTGCIRLIDKAGNPIKNVRVITPK